MKISEILNEGGWASVKTQGTVVTPLVLKKVVDQLKNNVEPKFNQWLLGLGVPAIKFGRPVGSGTYYEKHLELNPDKQYGDIDIQFIIPRIKEKTNSENKEFYQKLAKDFGDQTGFYESSNGKNIVVEIEPGQFAQVDLVSIYSNLVDWNDIFSPPEGVKGVLSASLYSALAESLNLSISDLGVQIKTANGQIVPFSKQKNVEIHTISSNPKTWALDIAKYFGSTNIDSLLEKYPGWLGESTIQQIVGSIQGIARTLASNNLLPENATAQDFLRNIQQIYLSKIDKVINSSKFDKAASPEALKKAEETKQLLRTSSQAIGQSLINMINENFGKNLAKLGLAAAVGLGAGQYAKNLSLPNLRNYLPHPEITQSPAEFEKIKKELDPVIKFLYSLEPNTLRDLLVDQAVMHGLKGIELAQFMAQTHHETGNFTHLVEIGSRNFINKKYDITGSNQKMAKQLGNTRPGDGWKYRGRGFIHLTGKANYAYASKALFGDNRLVINPELAGDPAIAANIALWYWGWRVQPNVSNFSDTKLATRPINPGLNGLKTRDELFKFYSSQPEVNKNIGTTTKIK